MRASRRLAVGVGVHDELGAAAQRRLGRGVHVADDHVGLEALREQRVGAAVDGEDRGLHVADVGPQRAQVLLVVDAAHDDERRPVAEVRVEARQLDAPGQQLALLEHVLDRVLRERLERVADLAAALVGGGADVLGLLHDRRWRAACRRGAPRRRGRWTRIAVGEALEERVVGQVDEVDARLDEQQRAHVRIGARRGRAAVEHGEDPRGDEVLRGDAIEVLVVEHGDGAGTQLLDEPLRPATEARRTSDLSASDDGHRASLDGRVKSLRRRAGRRPRGAVRARRSRGAAASVGSRALRARRHHGDRAARHVRPGPERGLPGGPRAHARARRWPTPPTSSSGPR